MRSISSWERRPFSFVITIFSLEPVPLSSAPTLRMPFASISKVTSICGTPRGAGGMLVRSNLPRRWQSLVMVRSPSNTWIWTVCWLSWYVVNVCDFLVGITVFLGMSLVITPPTVSMPWVSGATSSSRMSLASPSSPLRMPPCTAAPKATASSGLTPATGSLPEQSFLATARAHAMRVEPPTSTSSSTLPPAMGNERQSPASSRASCVGAFSRSTRSFTRRSKTLRVSVVSRSRGLPSEPYARKGRLMVVCSASLSSHLARSAASVMRCIAARSALASTPCCFLNSSTIHCATRASKSSPPSLSSPAVASTSKTPSPSSSTETSKVPPPRSNTSAVLRLSFAPGEPPCRPYASAAAVGSLMMRRTSSPAISPAERVPCRCCSLK
mmetsp:Transcript_11648/g.49008  ORF Transcript_11648/g.49008 Transcript_11648/m.49008 type:complete len:384 (-) Transcript_11648:508-1659(-)